MADRDLYAQAMREGHLHAWGGRWREAAASYRRALEAVPDDPAGRSSLAAALANGGSPAEALRLLESLAVEQPADSAIGLRLAELRQRAGRMDAADDAYLHVAGLYLASGQAAKAAGIWRRLIGLSGHRAGTMERLAAAADGAGEASLAAEAAALAASVGAISAATATAVAAPAIPSSDDGTVGALAKALRTRGSSPRTSEWPLDTPGGPIRATLDDRLVALVGVLDEPRAVRALALALPDAAAVPRLERALDVAELDGDVQLATALVRDLVGIGREAGPLYRRLIRLALIGGEVELAAEAHLALAGSLSGHDALAELRRARTVAPLSALVQAAAAGALAAMGAAFEADDARRRAFQLGPRVPGYAVAYAASAARRGAVEEMEIALDALDGGVGSPGAAARDSRGTTQDLLAADEGAAAMDRAGTGQGTQLAVEGIPHGTGAAATGGSFGLLTGPPALGRAVGLAVAELAGSTPAVIWCRGRLRTLVHDPAGAEDLRAAAAAPPPVGPRAALALAERELAAGRAAAAAEAIRRWIPPTYASAASPPAGGEAVRGGVPLEQTPDAPSEELASLGLRAADAAGDEPLALASLRALSDLAPEDAALGALLAERLAAAGRMSEAAQALTRLAELALAGANADAAGALYAAAVALNPDDPGLTSRTADLARTRGDREEARTLYLRLADLSADHRAPALLAAAELSTGLARTDLLRRAAAAAPADAEPRRRLVQALISAGQAPQAAAEAAALASLLEQQGNPEGAQEARAQARRLDPFNPRLASR